MDKKTQIFGMQYMCLTILYDLLARKCQSQDFFFFYHIIESIPNLMILAHFHVYALFRNSSTLVCDDKTIVMCS